MSDEKLKGQQRKCFSLLLSLLLSVGDNEGHENLNEFPAKSDRTGRRRNAGRDRRISLGEKGTNGGVLGRHASPLFSDVARVPDGTCKRKTLVFSSCEP